MTFFKRTEIFEMAFAWVMYQNDGFFHVFISMVVLYGYETWSLTLREERRLMVFDNRFLKTIFGPKEG
jgi:hypothetical protein